MANSHRAYVSCTHEGSCKEGEHHVIAGGSEKWCNEVLRIRIDGTALTGYVREMKESDLR